MTLFEACLTKPYRWLALIHGILVHVGKSAPVDGLQVVAFLLAIPVFEARYLLFQILYALQERRLCIAGVQQFKSGLQHSIEQFRGFQPNLGRGVERLQALRHIYRNLESRCG